MSSPSLSPEEQDWESYEIGNQKLLDESVYKKLGKYHFLANIFRINKNEQLIKTEIEENERRINGVELMESFRVCKKCGSRNIQSVPFQVAAADEAIPLKNTCLKCGFVEIER